MIDIREAIELRDQAIGDLRRLRGRISDAIDEIQYSSNCGIPPGRLLDEYKNLLESIDRYLGNLSN